MCMENLIEQINNAFKVLDKWHFIDNEDIQIKMFVGKKEVDLQIFKINGKHASLGFNYGSRKATKEGILNKITHIQI